MYKSLHNTLHDFEFKIDEIKLNDKNKGINSRVKDAFKNLADIARNADNFNTRVFIFVYVKAWLLIPSKADEVDGP